ncbi:MAG: DUF3168 domain-containing protein [Sulfitobacter sp.]|jgi:hypothetical protein|uniref:DUF3168 domain-containing protein n=1 Tax=unclassified Sulfitobacter TaxID=196795 RepID=UPI0007C375A1|nr:MULTISPECIES: DUF3168 domain-containing protein [unclassified Sulfitobacter]KZX98697.1 hypothetical protein A3720_15025 [Sulfitobacter sp. HI0021]KZY02071.1 hypothetical protein A3722_05945 [Sulfitobacter sp. HI0027]KZZ01283.1 hypothetical protein A3747_19475 [Sulfitobacter sp. HI0076]
MTYALSGALQAAVYDLLQSDPGLTAMIGDAVYDAVPGGSLPETYVLLGQEMAKDASDPEGAGADHRLTLSVITSAPGFSTAKGCAAVVCDLLHGAQPTLSRGHVVDMAFLKATARRIDGAAGRQIDLQFRARVADA